MHTSYDLAFVGSGIASSFTLLHLLRELDEKPVSDKIRIVVFEKSDEFITGIPYGERSGSSVLLITDLKSFIPEPEKSIYVEWLSTNKERLLLEMSQAGGERTQEWLIRYSESLAANKWDELFIPRRFFGIYLSEKINELIKSTTEAKKVTVDFIKADIQGIDKENDVWILRNDSNEEFHSDKVILGVGSLPTRPLWRSLPIEEEDGLMVINSIYDPGLDATIGKIRNFLASNSEVNVAIVGANAGAVEILYRLIDEGLGEYCGSFYFLSTHGVLPDSYLDEDKLKLKGYSPVNLINLASADFISAKDIYDASQKDIDAAESLEIGARTSVGVISSAIGNLLGKLELKELANFASKYGNEIGRRQRCAGEHYIDTIQNLQKAGRFNHIAGRFNDLVRNETGVGYHLLYKETKSGNLNTIKNPISLVINCSGSMSLESEHAPKILQELMQKDLAEPNDSGIGFKVDDQLKTKGGLHVVGPMVGGNVIQGKAVWHVEHCGRILWLSGLLAHELMDN